MISDIFAKYRRDILYRSAGAKITFWKGNQMYIQTFITSTCTSSASDGVEATAVRNCTGS